ncbi:MAG TPA: SDR family oxidoreductase [Aestuariivirgaceae bacterium]|nr:SDR family oxidoreductase [Aestuariivirgaceae bacterium]
MASVLITGANRGLGFEFARQYSAEGWGVYAASRNPAAAEQLRGLAQQAPDRFTLVAMDVTDAESIRTAARQLRDTAIDVLINNAGISGAGGQVTGKVDYESWARVLDVNMMGPLRVTEAFVDQLARSERRLVVTITSGMGSLSDNTSGGSIAYRSSKAGVNMVMRSAALDLAPRGISCVVVNPGWVKTDMGGPGARLTAQQSVAALRRLIETFGPAHSGKFYNYDGREYPW